MKNGGKNKSVVFIILFSVYIYIYIYIYIHTHTTLPKVLVHPLLMKCLSTLVIPMSTNLNI